MIQSQQYSLQSSFDKSLISSYITDSVIDMVEISIDNLVDSSVIWDIPVVKTMIGLIRTGANIQDRLFLKKIVSFLVSIDDISDEKRKKLIEDIDNSRTYRVKVGEKLLYLIDACADHDSSQLLAILFSALLREVISYDEFLKASAVIAKNQASTIREFLESQNDTIDMYENDVDIDTGLYTIHSENVSVSVRDNDDYDRGEQYIADVGDGGLWANPSRAGEILKIVFAEDKK